MPEASGRILDREEEDAEPALWRRTAEPWMVRAYEDHRLSVRAIGIESSVATRLAFRAGIDAMRDRTPACDSCSHYPHAGGGHGHCTAIRETDNSVFICGCDEDGA